MKTLALALLSLSFFSGAASASTAYTFTLNTPRGPIGFTYVSPEPLTGSSTYVNGWTFAGCDTTGAPGWICLDARLQQTTMNGLPIVQVTLEIADLIGWGDAFASDELTDTFPGASLGSTGTYSGFLSPTTLIINQSPDSTPAGAVPTAP